MRALLLIVLMATASLAPLAQADAADPLIVINEVLADPRTGEDEWIELYNAGQDVPMKGFTITDQDGHEYVFPDLVFPAGAYLVLAVGEGADSDFRNGTAFLYMGLRKQILNDDGDDLLLEGYGQVLDYFRYGDGSAVDPPPPEYPWEGSAQVAPEGLSLSLQPDGLVEDAADDWVVSRPTPGGANVPTADADVLITEVYYHANRDNEYVLLHNGGNRVVNLTGWRVSDGEGSWLLPPLLMEPGEGFLLARNATALQEDSGLRADACVSGCRVPLVTVGSLGLSDRGDQVLLVDGSGRLVDAFVYGSEVDQEGWKGEATPALPRGYVAKRRWDASGPLDTNSSADWEWGRTFRLGQGSRPVGYFEDVLVRPISSPESSLEALLSILNASRQGILLSGFTLTNPIIGAALERALERGIPVQVALEGRPPGGTDPLQEVILAELAAAGARILVMGAREDAWRRYAYHHAKYVIVDGTWVVLGSENFSINGFPRGAGNRGWGVVVFDDGVAAWLRDVAEEDWNISRSDVEVVSEGRAPPAVVARVEPPRDFMRADVVGMLSPDNAASPEGILKILSGARRSIDLELFYLRKDWRGTDNPLLLGLLEAAGRGVRVRLLLDGSSFNIQGKRDNDEVAAWVNDAARTRDLPMAARLFRPTAERVKLHNKGLIVDGEGVLISSINWNYHGAYENREAALYLISTEAATTFQADFEEDWDQRNQMPRAVIEGPATLRPGEWGVYSASASTDDISIVGYEWDLSADGRWDGAGATFNFTPSEPGRYVLRLRVWDAEGGEDVAELVIQVSEGGPSSVDIQQAALGMLSGLAALWWLRKLRTRRQPTNKSQSIERREGQAPDLGGRDREVRILPPELVALQTGGQGGGKGARRGEGQAQEPGGGPHGHHPEGGASP